MQINVAKSAGFCFGVKRALKIAQEAAKSHKNIFMLGDIVHNEAVVKNIERLGIKKIGTLKRIKNATLLIRAHGAEAKTLAEAKKIGYKIIDATCPMVKEIHRIAKDAQKQGYYLIVIGDKDHDEVRGIIGQTKNKALVIDCFKNIPWLKIKKIEKAYIVAQSTQNIEEVTRIIASLKKQIPVVMFFNTICNPTRTKQEEIKSMPVENEVMIIIGSKASANTKRLFEISKRINKNTFWIQSKNDLKKKWLRNITTVGITAGASTPKETINETIKAIKELKLPLLHQANPTLK